MGNFQRWPFKPLPKNLLHLTPGFQPGHCSLWMRNFSGLLHSSAVPCSLAARVAQEGKGCQHGKRSQDGVRTYGGLSHFRCLKRTPVPHVRLHMLHWLHTLQSPSTCSGMGVLLTHSPARHHCKASTLAQLGKKPWPCTGGLWRMSEGLQQVHI